MKGARMHMRLLFLAALLVATPSFAQIEEVSSVRKKDKVTKEDCPKLRKKLDGLHAQRTALGTALAQLERDRQETEILTKELVEYAAKYFEEFEAFKKRWQEATCTNRSDQQCAAWGCPKYKVEQEVEAWSPPKHAVLDEKISRILKSVVRHGDDFLPKLVAGNANLNVAPSPTIPASLTAKIADVPKAENVDPEWKYTERSGMHEKPQTWKWYDARPNAPVARNIAQWTKDVDQAYASAKETGNAVMERCLNEIITELSAEGNQVCSSEMIEFTKTVDENDPARERLGKIVDSKLQTYGQRVKFAEMNADAYLTGRVEKSSGGEETLKIKSKDTLTSTAAALRNSKDPRFRCAGMQTLIEGLKKNLGRKSDKVLVGDEIDLEAVAKEVKTKLPKDQTECSKS